MGNENLTTNRRFHRIEMKAESQCLVNVSYIGKISQDDLKRREIMKLMYAYVIITRP